MADNGRQGEDMVTLCWAAKGGSGTTVVVTTLALESARPSLIVDLAGDVPLVLGTPRADRPGVDDWLRGSGPPSQLIDLVSDVDDSTALLPFRLEHDCLDADPAPIRVGRWEQLLGWLTEWTDRHDGEVWIDAGTGSPPPAAEFVDRRWLVTRGCYLSLVRAVRCRVRPTAAVLVIEAGRALGPADVERALGVPIVATVSYDPKVARAVDAGLVVSRPPFVIRRELRKVTA